MGSPRFPLQFGCGFGFGWLHKIFVAIVFSLVRTPNIKELNAKVSANNCHKYTQLIIATFIYHKTFCGMCKLFIFGFKTYLTRKKNIPIHFLSFYSHSLSASAFSAQKFLKTNTNIWWCTQNDSIHFIFSVCEKSPWKSQTNTPHRIKSTDNYSVFVFTAAVAGRMRAIIMRTLSSWACLLRYACVQVSARVFSGVYFFLYSYDEFKWCCSAARM